MLPMRPARRARPRRRGVVNKPAPGPAPRGSKSDRVGSGRVGSARIQSDPVVPQRPRPWNHALLRAGLILRLRSDVQQRHTSMGGPRHGRLALARSLARSLGALAATRRRQKPGSAASVSRCRADHDDAPGTHVGRPHDHDTPSVIGITAASSAHVHCVPWKFERAPSAMFGETLAGLLRGSNAPPRDDTAKRVGT